MRSVLFSFLVMLSLSTRSQQDSVEIIHAPSITAIGNATGEKVSGKFSKDGGRLVSADGRLELIIPEGALPSKTTVSIESIENTLPNGNGAGYALEPSGVTFRQPLQIRFHYSDRESAGAPADLKGIAWQDDNGQWHRLPATNVDSINRTITGTISHFSRWTFFDEYSLVPVRERLKVNKQLTLQIIEEDPLQDLAPESNSQVMPTRQPRALNNAVITVNGVVGGNAVAGRASGQPSGGSIRYTAPASVPDQNPVAVAVEVDAMFNQNPQRFRRLKLVSNITIYDKAFEIKVNGYNQQNTLQCTITAIDSSTCILQLNGNRSKLQDIQNVNYHIKVESCDCNVHETNPGTSAGPVNIIGAQRIEVVPANPPQKPYASVTIYFIRNMGILAGMAVDPCHGQPAISMPPMPIPAVPYVVQFDAKDEEQVIKQGGDQKNGFKIIVKPVRDDN